MINRYSSRREALSDSFLGKKLKNAKGYDRIAGYFRSSIIEVAGEDLNSVEGKIRMICNSDLAIKDVATAKLANSSIRKEWCDFKPEELPAIGKRFRKLYEFLSSGKLEVRVLPDERFGLIHGKAGVITLSDGTKTSFLGSINESRAAWKTNYELVWEDSSLEAVKWVQEEFDALWYDKFAVPLSDFVVEDIKRISERVEIETVEEWREEEKNPPASVVVESPVYRKQLGLWEHQKYFVDLAFREHKQEYGARYILADQVGLGKTIQLAMAAQLMALSGDKPILVIVPKTLMSQWQGELNSLLDMPSAIWNGKEWVDENNFKYPNRGSEDILKCPRRVGIISQGLIVANSPVADILLNREYECVIVDEAHRARRKKLGDGKESEKPQMNNMYEYLMKISPKTKSMLLATATPIQMHPVELWDLMNILSQKNDSVLGSKSSYWRKPDKVQKGLDFILGKREPDFFDPENWEWIRNPFPPKFEHPVFASVRMNNKMQNSNFVLSKSYLELLPKERQRIGNILTADFFSNYNPYIRHVVRRERKYLEIKTDPNTGEPFLKPIKVNLYGEDDEDALILTGYLKQAYDLAEEFCNSISKRAKGGGFLKTLLLKRIGSSIEAGKNTGYKMLTEWNTGMRDLEAEEDDYDEVEDAEIKNLTDEEIALLDGFVKALSSTEAIDPKYNKTVELLRDKNWMDDGVIIFSQYFDTAKWISEKLSCDFPDELIGLYAGGDKSGFYFNGNNKKADREEVKKAVESRKLRVLVGTDAASEGLNLQTLGRLINIDLPWNPTKLEQRKGRIQRIGQINDEIHIYNMRYKDSVEDRVHQLLSKRLKNISDVFGQLPDVLEDVWINIAAGEEKKARELIDNIPEVHPFENRYNNSVTHIDWESCSRVLNKKEKRKYLEEGW